MRRTCYIAALVISATLISTGCSSNTTPTGKSVSEQTVKGIVGELKLKSLSDKNLHVTGAFVFGGSHVTIASIGGQRAFVSVESLVSATRNLTGLTTTRFTAHLSGYAGKLDFHATVNPEPERLLVFLPNTAMIQTLGNDSGHAIAAYHQAFTARLANGKGRYNVSFVGNYGVNVPTYGVDAISINVAATYVELCQNVLNLTTDTSTLAYLRAQPGWDDTSGKAKSLLQLVRQIGQEVTCNSVGLAMSFSRGGVAYEQYQAIASAAKLRMIKPIEIPLITFDRGRYDAFAQ